MEKKEKRRIDWKTVFELFITTFKIGSFTFGGGYAMVPIMQDEFAVKRTWVEERDIGDIFAVAQSLPGVIALNSSVFIGYRVMGIPGAVAAGLGVSLPSLIIISIIIPFYLQLKDNVYVTAALTGIRACVVALIIQAVVKLGKPALKDIATWVIALISFAAVIFFGVNPVFIILGTAAAGVVISLIKRNTKGGPAA